MSLIIIIMKKILSLPYLPTTIKENDTEPKIQCTERYGVVKTIPKNITKTTKFIKRKQKCSQRCANYTYNSVNILNLSSLISNIKSCV